MMNKYSRKQLAEYIVYSAFRSEEKRREAIYAVANYLIETGRTKEFDLLIYMVNRLLSEKGYYVGELTVADKLDEDQKQAIIDCIKKVKSAKNVELHEKIDKSIIGGYKLEIADELMDATISHKLLMLRKSI